jgi:hypothetical protein
MMRTRPRPATRSMPLAQMPDRSDAGFGTTCGTGTGAQTIHDKILTKYDKNTYIHVDKFQERHFLRINKNNTKNIAGGGSALIKYAAKAPSIHTKLQAFAGRR